MAHEVKTLEYVSNTNLASTGVPWHGLGTPHTDWLTDQEAKDALDWEVEKRPSYRLNSSGVYEPIDGAFHIVRVDTDKVLGPSVGKVYSHFQNRDLIDFGSTLVDDFGAKWDTVGSLRDDKIVFATLRLDIVTAQERGLCPLSFDKSEFHKWLLLRNSHDGQSKLRGSVTDVRTVCMNTLVFGERVAHNSWEIRHTGDLMDRVKEARRSLDMVTRYDEEFAALAEKLVNLEVEVDDFEELTKSLFPADGVGKRQANSGEAARTALKSNFLHSKLIDDDWRFTGWGAFNAVTDWAEHDYSGRPDKRTSAKEVKLLSTLFGGKVQKIRDNTAGWLLNRAS